MFVDFRSDCSHITLRMVLFLVALTPKCAGAQSGAPVIGQANQIWAGRRIVMLQGFADYFISDDRGQAQLVRPEGLGVNIVAVAQRVEEGRVWIKANGAGEWP